MKQLLISLCAMALATGCATVKYEATDGSKLSYRINLAEIDKFEVNGETWSMNIDGANAHLDNANVAVLSEAAVSVAESKTAVAGAESDEEEQVGDDDTAEEVTEVAEG